MREVGFLQVKVIKATDLLSTDLNGDLSSLYCTCNELPSTADVRHLQMHTQCNTSLIFCRKKRSILCTWAWEQQTANSYHLQNIESSVEQSLDIVTKQSFIVIEPTVLPSLFWCKWIQTYFHKKFRFVLYCNLQPDKGHPWSARADCLWWRWRQSSRLSGQSGHSITQCELGRIQWIYTISVFDS